MAVAIMEPYEDYLVMSWDEINSVPVPERGNIWRNARAAISTIADHQAFIETAARESLDIGEKMGQLNQQTAARLDNKTKAKMSREGGIKETVREIQCNGKG